MPQQIRMTFNYTGQQITTNRSNIIYSSIQQPRSNNFVSNVNLKTMGIIKPVAGGCGCGR